MFRIFRHQINRMRIFADIHSQHCNSITNSSILSLTRSYCTTKPYKAAILEEFNKKLAIESITNRTKLGQGMVGVIAFIHILL